MSYFLKLWFKVQFVEWEKYNQENLVNLVKNLQETACVEVRLHTQYFDKNWKIQKNMKAKICFWIQFIVLFCCGCAEENEVPPYRKTSTEAYVMPKPVPLTPEERALIDSKREEYKNAIKGQ